MNLSTDTTASSAATLSRLIWFYIGSGLVLLALGIAGITALYSWDHSLHEDDHRIDHIELHVAQLDALEWRAIASGIVSEEISTKVTEIQHETTVLIGELQASQAGLATNLEELSSALQRYQLAVDQEFALIRSGDLVVAREFDETEVDPAFAEVAEAVEHVSTAIYAQIDQYHGFIPVTFYGLIAFLLGTAATLLWLFLNARHRSELAVAEQTFLQQARQNLEEQVKLRTAELDQSNRQLQHEIAERKQIEEQLRLSQNQLELRVAQRTLQLEQSNRQLEQFAYVASHDLQEPLRMVSGYLQLIERRYQTQLDDDGREFIHFAVDGAKRMQQLIRDLLAYSRIATQGRQFAFVDLATILTQILSNLQLLIAENQAVITHDPLPSLRVDATQIGQVLQNLLANAIKFRGQPPPRIHLHVQEQPTSWRFALQDNGIGFEPQYAERIFLIFQRLHTRESYPGTGIGLAICKRIIERHGGQIWVESTPGHGSTFYFTLPKQEPTS